MLGGPTDVSRKGQDRSCRLAANSRYIRGRPSHPDPLWIRNILAPQKCCPTNSSSALYRLARSVLRFALDAGPADQSQTHVVAISPRFGGIGLIPLEKVSDEWVDLLPHEAANKCNVLHCQKSFADVSGFFSVSNFGSWRARD